MNALIATALFLVGMAGLFYLGREVKVRTSPALWVPVIWFSIAASRNVSEWLQGDSGNSAADPYLEGSPLDRNILTVILALGVIALIARRYRVWRILRANAPIVLFFVYCGVSVLWSDYPDVSLKRWFRALGDLVMVLVVLSDADWLSAFKRVLARVSFILVPLSILFIRYYPDLGRRYSRWDGQGSWVGVATDKNGLGIMCVIFALASVWRMLTLDREGRTAGKSKLLIAHGIFTLMALWLIWEANSATALSTFVLAGVVMVMTCWFAFARKPVMVHIMVWTGLAVAFSALFLGIGSGLVEGLGRNTTLTGRTEIWRLVLGMVQNPILGTGFESFWIGPRLDKMWALYYNHVNQAHNGYIEVYLNLGWVGIGLLAVMIIAGYRRIATAVCTQTQAGSLRLAYFIVGVAYNFTEGGFKMMNPVWIAFLLAIMAVPKSAVPRRRKKSVQFASTELLDEAVPRVGDWESEESSPSDMATALRPFTAK